MFNHNITQEQLKTIENKIISIDDLQENNIDIPPAWNTYTQEECILYFVTQLAINAHNKLIQNTTSPKSYKEAFQQAEDKAIALTQQKTKMNEEIDKVERFERSGKIRPFNWNQRSRVEKLKFIECGEINNVGINYPLNQMKEATQHDPVNHPKHYTSHPSGIECIQITRHMTFNIGNAVKYLWRADLKNNTIEDLEKAIYYIKDEIKRLEPIENYTEGTK